MPTANRQLCQNRPIPPASPGVRVSFIRTSLLAIVCLSQLPGADSARSSIYFEQRSSGLYLRPDPPAQSVTIRPDRIALDGVTLRFVHPSKARTWKGRARPRPAPISRAARQAPSGNIPKPRIRHLYPGVDLRFYGHPGHLEYDLDLAPGASPDRIRIRVMARATSGSTNRAT